MKTLRHLVLAAVATLTTALTACDDYGDDLRAIGHRVEALEADTLAITDQLTAISHLLQVVQTHGYVTSIVTNDDGSTTLHFNDESGTPPLTLANGQNGTDGRTMQALLTIMQDETDSIYYWVFNGYWLLDTDGNRVKAQPTDGRDGRDGVDGKDGQDGRDGQDAEPLTGEVVMPQVRINVETRTWEISLDGGNTWRDTGVDADGKDGQDGKDGADGKDGQDGKDGADGKDGRDGKDGADGKDGQGDKLIQNIFVTDTSVVFIIVTEDGTVQTIVLPRIPD